MCLIYKLNVFNGIFKKDLGFNVASKYFELNI